MKLTELKSLILGTGPDGAERDRLTPLLIGVAVVLLIALLVVAADLLLAPTSDEPAAQVRPPASPSTVPTAVALATATITPTPGTPPPCIVPDDWGIHIIEQGNTLFSLGQHYGTDVETLIRVNCLNGPTIYVDQRLYVPGPLALPTFATATPDRAEYLPTGALSQPEALATSTPQPETTAVQAAASLPAPTAAPKTAFQANIPAHHLNIALLGTDKRPDRDLGVNLGQRNKITRADAIVIVSVDTEDNIVRLLHVPRDLWVFIPGEGYDRINTAYTWAELAEEGSGPERIKQTLYLNLGIPVHYYIEMDFQGFINVIDTLGGVDIDVDCPIPEINLEPGIHHLDGIYAMAYIHRRDTSDDFDRGRRQEKLLMALWEQALTPSIVAKLPELWVAMADNFKTDLPLDQVINLAYMALQTKPQHIRKNAIDYRHVEDWVTPAGSMVLLPHEEAIRALLESFYAPVDTTRQDTAEKVHIEVLNGWYRQDAEDLAAVPLGREGFKVARIGTADRQDYLETQILVYNGDLAAGEKVARHLGVPFTAVQDLTTAPAPPDLSSGADIRIILGQDYDPCQR